MMGRALADVALAVFARRRSAYPEGISVPDLASELRQAGVPVDGEDPHRTLSDALNASQVDNVWARQEGATWLPGSGVARPVDGLSGRALADDLYDFVRARWPSGRFHHEEARVQLEKTGVRVRGTGSVTRAALSGAPDRFAPVEGARGWWRWLPPRDRPRPEAES
jgi:hypothetical protein